MKSHLFAVSAVLLLASGSLAAADEVIVVPDQTDAGTVVVPDQTDSTTVIAPEQETVIHEYIKRKPIASISLLGVDLALGSTVPDTVELHRVEAPNVQYRYAVVNDHTVLVDPSTRRIVEVVQ